MPRVLVISSYVAHGTVGLQATLPAFAAAGIETLALPTVVLSNHPGHQACAGTALTPEVLVAMADALHANGWMNSLDAVFTGYLPSASHVACARRIVTRLKAAKPSIHYFADPVLGDDPNGLYVNRDTAEAVRDQLLPLANLITPNRFELEWLSGVPIVSAATAVEAARRFSCPMVAATSIPGGPNTVANVLVTNEGSWTETNARVDHAPHGTGDYFAGVFAATLIAGASAPSALQTATRDVVARIAASAGLDYLTFVAAAG